MPEPLDVAKRYYEGLVRIDAAGVAGLLTQDAKVEVPGATLTGPEQFKGWMQVFFDAFPDITHEHAELEVDGSNVSTELSVKGTHTAPLVSPQGTVPATGKPIEIQATNTMRVEGDRIVELSISFDQDDFMRQLGMG
jgi:predicted ester cyclase